MLPATQPQERTIDAAQGGGLAVEPLVRELAWLLVAATLIGMLAQQLRVPYAIALVLAGVAIGTSPGLAVPRLDPQLMLLAFLPPLLFDAAFRLDAAAFAGQLRTILLLALPGVVLTAGAVGAALWLVLGLPLPVGLLFGSLVAATDPVAVTSVFRSLRVGTRLATLVEAESLINDGTAITLYTGLVGLVLANRLEPLDLGRLFVFQVVGGVLVGITLGLVAARLTRRIDDHLVEMTLSTALAYGSFLLGHEVGASGPLACVAAGLVHGTYGRRTGMSETNRRLLDDLWEYLGFLANGLVFLLLGLTVDLPRLLAEAGPSLVAIVAVVIARVVVIELATRLAGAEKPLSPAERIVTGWGGLRGALTVALALGLPAEVGERDLLIAMAFAVVLFTLVVQGLTLAPLIRRLRLGQAA